MWLNYIYILLFIKFIGIYIYEGKNIRNSVIEKGVLFVTTHALTCIVW